MSRKAFFNNSLLTSTTKSTKGKGQGAKLAIKQYICKQTNQIMSNQLNNYGQPDDVSTNGGTGIGIVNQSSTTPKKEGNPKDDRDYSFNDDENVNNNSPHGALPRLRHRTRVSGTEDEEWDGSDTDDDTDDEDYHSTKTAAKKKKKKTTAKKSAAAKKKSAASKPTVHSKTKASTKHEMKRRGKNVSSRKGMKLNMSKEGSATHSQVMTENNKNRRKYGEKFLPVLNKKETIVPESISDEFSRVVTFEDIMVWAGDSKTGEFIGIKVKNHLALGMWLGQTKLKYLNQLMKSLGFKPKYEGWSNRQLLSCREFEPIRNGSKSMIWTHPTFRPESNVTDLTYLHSSALAKA